jgi:hypothetical protein
MNSVESRAIREVVVYDPGEPLCWGVAEHMRSVEYVLVIAAASLSEALSGM